MESLPDDLRARMEKVEGKTGFLPHVFRTLAWRPEEWRAHFAYNDALMDSNEGLSKAERELIAVAVSAVNNCLYCTVAHGAIYRVRSRRPLVADQVATDWRKAELTPRESAIVAFAVKLTRSPVEVGEADYEALARAGLTEGEIWDVGAIAAFFNMGNRLAHMMGLMPNDEFYPLGREFDPTL
jgi:uncharacterized peroxidase-related enzyme